MKSKREQVHDKLIVIKLFGINYARDLVNTNLNIYGQNTAFENFFIILQSSPIKNETFDTKDIGLIVN